MAGCYVSPIPTKVIDRYSRSKGRVIPVRSHLFPNPHGREPTLCEPRKCREHWRETNWHDHGDTDAG